MPNPTINVPLEGMSTEQKLLIQAINVQLTRLQDQISAQDLQPSFHGNINMNGFRICDVGDTGEESDAAPRSEIIRSGMMSDGKQHVATHRIVAKEGIRTMRKPRENDELATVQVAREFSAGGGGADSMSLSTSQKATGRKQFGIFALTPTQYDMRFLGNPSFHNHVFVTSLGVFIESVTPRILTGVVADPSTHIGNVIIVSNVTESSFTIEHDVGVSSGSDAMHRFFNPGGIDLLLRPSGSATYYYNTKFNRWLIIARSN